MLAACRPFWTMEAPVPPRESDRALRRLVAELATVSAEDVEDILSQLKEPDAREVRTLLASYLAADGDSPGPVSPEPGPPLPIRIDGLSPWLSARLGSASDSTTPRRRSGARPSLDPYGRDAGLAFSMTPVALDALRSCAAALQLELGPAPAATPPPPQGALAWLERLRRGMTGTFAAS